jgi:hypothetical protein
MLSLAGWLLGRLSLNHPCSTSRERRPPYAGQAFALLDPAFLLCQEGCCCGGTGVGRLLCSCGLWHSSTKARRGRYRRPAQTPQPSRVCWILGVHCAAQAPSGTLRSPAPRSRPIAASVGLVAPHWAALAILAINMQLLRRSGCASCCCKQSAHSQPLLDRLACE